MVELNRELFALHVLLDDVLASQVPICTDLRLVDLQQVPRNGHL